MPTAQHWYQCPHYNSVRPMQVDVKNAYLLLMLGLSCSLAWCFRVQWLRAWHQSVRGLREHPSVACSRGVFTCVRYSAPILLRFGTVHSVCFYLCKAKYSTSGVSGPCSESYLLHCPRIAPSVPPAGPTPSCSKYPHAAH